MTGPAAAELLHADGVRVVRPSLMPWTAPDPGEPFGGSTVLTKVLARSEEGWVLAQLLYRPPGSSSSAIHGAPERHFHRFAREWVYVFDGALSFREYDDSLDPEGRAVTYYPGYLLDRLPGEGSSHGVDPAGTTTSHASLEIRTSPSTTAGETGYDDHNVSIRNSDLGAISSQALRDTTLSDGATDAGLWARTTFETAPSTARVVYQSERARIFDTAGVHWTPTSQHDIASVGFGCVISPHPDGGSALAELIHIPQADRERPVRPMGDRTLIAVTEGAGQIKLKDESITLRPGDVVDAAAGSVVGLQARDGDPRGLTCLLWRLDRIRPSIG